MSLVTQGGLNQNGLASASNQQTEISYLQSIALGSSPLIVTDAINQLNFDINSSPFSAITNISNDFIFDSLEINFSTVQTKTITVTSVDGTILWGGSVDTSSNNLGYNTTAALGTGLGGFFYTQPTLAQGVDGVVCNYAAPVGSVSITPRTLYITGVRVQSAVSTAIVGGPVVFAYSLAYGHTNVSLATTDTASFATATTKSPRKIALGMESISLTAAVGVIGTGVFMPFTSPIVVNPGENIAIVARNLGVVSSAGVVGISVAFDGYWE